MTVAKPGGDARGHSTPTDPTEGAARRADAARRGGSLPGKAWPRRVGLVGCGLLGLFAAGCAMPLVGSGPTPPSRAPRAATVASATTSPEATGAPDGMPAQADAETASRAEATSRAKTSGRDEAGGLLPGLPSPMAEPHPDPAAPTVSLTEILPILGALPDSPHYTIEPAVRMDGPYAVFAVHCAHGTYRVMGVRNLIRICREIDAIEAFRATPQGNQILKGAVGNVKETLRGAGMLVRHPGVTAKRAVWLGGRVLRDTKRFVADPFQPEEERLAADGTDRAAGGRGWLYGPELRKVAWELNVDIYTENPNVHGLVREVAKRRAAGALLIKTGKFMAPGASLILETVAARGPGRLTLTPQGASAAVEKRISLNSPEELLYRLGMRYSRLHGLSQPELARAEALLENRNYSPREQAYLEHNLYRLRGLGERGAVLRALAETPTPGQARRATAELELLAAIHEGPRPGTAFLALPGLLGFRDGDGRIVCALPYDLAWRTDDELRAVIQGVAAAGQGQGAGGVDLWLLGRQTKAFKDWSREVGFTVHDALLTRLDPPPKPDLGPSVATAGE